MSFVENKKKMTILLTVGFLVVTGTYNAVVINSESSISGTDVKFVKRLDEVYGVVRSGREVAAAMNWKKIPVAPQVIQAPVPQVNAYSAPVQTQSPSVVETPQQPVSNAAYTQELNLTLEKAENSKLWKTPLTASQFSGSLSAAEGVIEGLNVSLPGGLGISVSFAEMEGNGFLYEYDGQQYNGVIYQVDQTSWKVHLSDGPLESTALMFRGQPSADDEMRQQEALQEQERIAANSDTPSDVDGSNVEMPVEEKAEAQPVEEVAQAEAAAYVDQEQAQDLASQDQQAQEQAMQDQQAQGFNQEQPQAM